MAVISRKVRANPEGRVLKPHVFGKPPAKTKLIRLDDRDLRLIERATRKLDPRPTSSYFIVSAAIERAKAVLGPAS
jgi:hypothetical protein